MNTLNLLRTALIECAWTNKIYSKQFPEYSKISGDILNRCKESVKFILPDNGKIFNDKLRGLPDEFKLPFPQIIIEYICNNENGLASDHFGKENVDDVRERIIYANQIDDSIEIASIIGIKIDGKILWHLQPFIALITPRHKLSIEKQEQMQPVDNKAVNNNIAVELFDVGGMAKFQFGENWDEHAYYNMADEYSAVLELIEALTCSNVNISPLEIRKQNKSAAKRGALPFDLYHILTIQNGDLTSLTEPIKSSKNNESFERRHLREHLRRGFIRTFKTGKKTWVNATVVNAGSKNSVIKTYKTKENYKPFI